MLLRYSSTITFANVCYIPFYYISFISLLLSIAIYVDVILSRRPGNTRPLSISSIPESQRPAKTKKKKKKKPASVHSVRGRRSRVWLFRVSVYSPAHTCYKTSSCPWSSLPRRVRLTRYYYCSRRLYNQTFYTVLSFHFLKQKKLAKIEIRGPRGIPLKIKDLLSPRRKRRKAGVETTTALKAINTLVERTTPVSYKGDSINHTCHV